MVKKYRKSVLDPIEIAVLIRTGKKHTEAIRMIANRRKVDVQTISSNCTRGIGLSSIEEFLSLVDERKLIAHLEEHYTNDKGIIL